MYVVGPVPNLLANDTTDTFSTNLQNAGFFFAPSSYVDQLDVLTHPILLSTLLNLGNAALILLLLLVVYGQYWLRPVRMAAFEAKPGFVPLFAWGPQTQPLLPPPEAGLEARPQAQGRSARYRRR